MTSTDETRNPESSLRWRAGHASPWLLAGIWVAQCILEWVNSSPRTFLTVGPSSILWLVFAYIVLATIDHERQTVCTRCVYNVPEDGEDQAQTKTLTLGLYHWMTSSRGVALFGTLTLAWAACLVLWGDTLLSDLLFVTLTIVAVGFNYPLAIHRPLVRWCPWCNDHGGGDDDDEEVTPEPDPAPANEKTRT